MCTISTDNFTFLATSIWTCLYVYNSPHSSLPAALSQHCVSTGWWYHIIRVNQLTLRKYISSGPFFHGSRNDNWVLISIFTQLFGKQEVQGLTLSWRSIQVHRSPINWHTPAAHQSSPSNLTDCSIDLHLTLLIPAAAWEFITDSLWSWHLTLPIRRP